PRRSIALPLAGKGRRRAGSARDAQDTVGTTRCASSRIRRAASIQGSRVARVARRRWVGEIPRVDQRRDDARIDVSHGGKPMMFSKDTDADHSATAGGSTSTETAARGTDARLVQAMEKAGRGDPVAAIRDLTQAIDADGSDDVSLLCARGSVYMSM